MSENNRTMELNEEEIKHISGGSNGNGSPITVDLSLCDGCGECARNCSYDAINFVDGKVCIDDNLCTKCCVCEVLCPPGAITLN